MLLIGIKDVINNVLSSPVSAANVVGVVTATAKWKGVTGDDIKITVDTGDDALGVGYVVAAGVAGVGVVRRQAGPAQFTARQERQAPAYVLVASEAARVVGRGALRYGYFVDGNLHACS